ncbi:Outer membrane receptor for ferric coprogen and ferric-rhodotorulic acid [plant metagenome]|uniref:Outer membrane receptor for ferric coprogen and ferric-rhodotorulic acid n=1 Tax=plant metagenome TaxID=1297885 RepID=A0A484RMH6_9ZZZZ
MQFQPTRLAAAVAVVMALSTGQAAAQSPAPSDNATINLIRLLVQQGVIKQDQADALLKQAEADAVRARSSAAPAAAAGGAGAAIAQPGDVRVPYIPETVRAEIRDEVKNEVMAQAKAENWAQPNTFPDWVSRITIEGDVRVRNESRFFDDNNVPGALNFNRWNDNGPMLIVAGNQNYFEDRRFTNTREDRRNLWRIRARLGVKAQLSDAWTAGVRLATGSDDNPVSTSDTLGNSMGKKNLWLDQAYLTYRATDWMTATAGRAGNPFASTDLLYSGDLNFDGISAAFKKPLSGRPVTLFGTIGAFVLDYGNNSSSAWSYEGKSENKWLLGAQVGADWKINSDNSLRGSLAYYQFENISGKRSSQCSVLSSADVCDTDWSRPSFMQKGNTLFLLRDIVYTSANPDDWNQWQYVGLASKFNLLDVNMRWDTRVFDGMGLRLAGNYVRNLAYKDSKIIRRAGGANNLATNQEFASDDSAIGVKSGPNAWMLQATLGNGFGLQSKGDWMAFVGYKYIQPDAMPDAYNDSTFHLGGTNAQGYYVGAGYAVDKNVFAQLRWTSSKEIYGAPLAIDILQLELNARF